MRQCLTSDQGGYYTTRDHALADSDQFGKRGDFVTSPEISQIFGELVGIWFVAEWMAQGKKSSGVQLVELGPGRGTLMDDALRSIGNFRSMASAIDTIYLVEASPVLREAQRKTLCGEAKMEEHTAGYQSKSKHLPNATVVWVEDLKFIPRGMTPIPISFPYHYTLTSPFPPESNKTPLIIAHEFLDALPIHAFQSVITPHQAKRDSTNPTEASPSAPNYPPLHAWRELFVSPTAPPSVIDPPKEPGPEFELTVGRTATRRSRVLPELSERYKKLLPISGATFEVSPEARTTTTALTDMIAGTPSTSSTAPTTPSSSTTSTDSAAVGFTTASGKLKPRPSGAALIIDYGPASTVPISTLRGIRAHAQVSPFEKPGTVDISADVDFGAVVETALESSEQVEVHGPVEQGGWLEGMGGRERSEMLLKAAERAEGEGKEGAKEVRERLEGGWKRLVDRGPDGMGRLYKVLAIVPERGGRRPVGFGGGLDGS